MLHIHNGILLSHQQQIMPFEATWMQIEILTLSEEVRKRKINAKCTYMQNLKYGINEPIYKRETDSRDIENRLGVAKGEGGWSGMDGELGVGRCKLLHFEWINKKVQSPGIDHDGK